MNTMPNLRDVYTARNRIKGYAIRTPFIASPALAEEAGAAAVYLKLESLQNTGAFKVRGAANKILGLSEEERQRGVVTFSTGNHGKAVAFVAGKSGIPATVCLSEHVPSYRAELIRSFGATVHIEGQSQDEAEAAYERMRKEKGLVPVVPFDDPAIVAGQGTIALEMLEERPDLDVLLVPLSGGGLLAGVALCAKSVNPAIKVVGVSIERSPAMLESLKAGHPVAVEEKDTLADSLLGGIGAENHYTLPLISRYVDDHIVVGEEEIRKGLYYALKKHSLVIEGAAAVGIAAILAGKVSASGGSVGLVVSGSSVELDRYIEVVRREADAES
ncbi:pyridoxal-phosphate dependent enzyme [Sediminispirochaeta smaragdinae]|uniref:Pyridoxal-5'-phosphate-dependent protein beta subunit n=1 Tax=Sediminispirochaeta smaragdinae (strain DSM 11293 / JCM 15392 / SEBR 4228) TaxID=573413 RepID=E1RBI6_SEDSS|nr:pyridoxal-phosphate dependent enzyme [Sediminispirochaeta smaragdinae]ADK79716.1 Pyridoxal-5'-phosphate-dependent protein beta subunit [Sediminispirochaeta smaragdinae DSM 11293]